MSSGLGNFFPLIHLHGSYEFNGIFLDPKNIIHQNLRRVSFSIYMDKFSFKSSVNRRYIPFNCQFLSLSETGSCVDSSSFVPREKHDRSYNKKNTKENSLDRIPESFDITSRGGFCISHMKMIKMFFGEYFFQS